MNQAEIAYYRWQAEGSPMDGSTAESDWAYAGNKLARLNHDFRNMKLGRKTSKPDGRTLKMEKYLSAELPAPPASVDWLKGVTEFGELMNDTLGCCTVSAIGHAVQVWTLNASEEASITDATVLQKYEHWAGYVPSDPSTDQGAEIITILKAWRKHNFAGYQLDVFAEVSGQAEVQQSIALFGIVDIGLKLPISAQQQAVWDVTVGPNSEVGSWGGHSVVLAAYDETGPTCITWGQPLKMTWAFFFTYCTEAKALLSNSWLMRSGTAPSGVDWAQLNADVQAVTA